MILMLVIKIILLLIFISFGLVVLIGAPYVPSLHKNLLETLTRLYKIGKKDILLDLGSGSGLVLNQASQLGAKAIGYEINPFLVIWSKIKYFSNKNIKTYWGNFWVKEIPSDVTVVYAFIVTRDTKKLADKLQKIVNLRQQPLHLISFGNAIPGLSLVSENSSHYLYLIRPQK